MKDSSSQVRVSHLSSKARGVARGRVVAYLRIALGVAAVVAGSMAGCSGDDPLPPYLGAGAAGGGGPIEAGPCQDGVTRACGFPVKRQGNVVSCFRGTQTCQSGTWGECGDGTVTEELHEPPPPGGFKTQALGPPVNCMDNPCDPFCKRYNEVPDGGLISTNDAGVLFEWSSGSITNLPSALAGKGKREPCRWASDCQFNQRCQDVFTPQACGHSKCRTGAQLQAACDPCVNLICSQDPSCCSNCDHSYCQQGTRLDVSCGSCVAAVCAARPSCCSTTWDAACVAQVATSCPAGSCVCRAGEREFNGHCYTELTTGDSWSLSRQNCRDRGPGWDLVSIGSQAENDFVTSMVSGSETWIGNSDSDVEGTWVWSNGEANTYQNWYRFPDNQGDCVRMNGSTGTWEDRGCGTVGTGRGSVCERAGVTGCPAGNINNGNCYWLNTAETTWDDARAACQAHIEGGTGGFDLATVNDQAENDFLVTFVTIPLAWIGLNDRTTENTFTWISGSTSTYRNWRQIEPDGSYFLDDCGLMSKPGDRHDGFWYDETCSDDSPNALCEGPPAESGWSQACVDRVKSACDATCSTANPPSRAGVCIPWLPGQRDTSCTGTDLALGVPCAGGVVPVCNHGTTTAPAGVKVIHFPAGAAAFGTCNPNLTLRDDNDTCVTTTPIEPGKCVNVTCSSLTDTDELMVNPAGLNPQAECSCLDNWSIYSSSVSCGAPACSGGVSQAVFRRVNMFIMFDRSGSMQDDSKWDGAKEALTQFFQAPQAAGLGVALEYFPLPSGTVAGRNAGDGCASGNCDENACAAPMVPLGVLTAVAGDPHETALIQSLDVGPFGNGTPSHPALRGAYLAARNRQQNAPDEYNIVVFVTDGAPNGCFYPTSGGTAASTNLQLAVEAESNYLQYEIPTYTVCMTGGVCSALSDIASRGRGRAFTVSSTTTAQVAQELRDALLSIASQNASCNFELPNVGGFNPNESSVVYTPGTGAAQNLSRQTNSTSCGAGWYFDDPLNPTRITLCPTTCSTIQTDPAARIEVGFGCPKLVGAQTITEVYTGECDAGSGPQWGFLTYNTTIPGDSSVRFQMRTANTLTDLSMASWMDLAVVPPDPAVCTRTGPGPECPIDLYRELSQNLTALTNTRLRYVELGVTLNPTSNSRFSPTLNDWKITYSCQPNE
jgi:hypothetical protein